MSLVRVLCTIAIRPSYGALVPGFEQAGGARVETEWGGIVDIRNRMRAGATPDLVVASGTLVDELAAAGLVDGASRRDLARSTIGAAVPRGAPRPDLRSPEAVRAAVASAPTVAISSGPSGDHLRNVFAQWQIASSRIIQTRSGVLVGSVLERGEATLGFQQICELRAYPAIDFVGPLPPALQVVTVMAGAVRRGAQNAAGATSLLSLLAGSPEAFVAYGLEPCS